MKNLVQKSAIALLSFVSFLLPQTVLADTFRFTVISISGCYSSGCEITVRSASGKKFDVTYSQKLGINEGDTVLVDINDDGNWKYVINPQTNKVANIIKIYRY